MPMRTTVAASTKCGKHTLNAAARRSAAIRRFPTISFDLVINPLDFPMTIFYAVLCNGCASKSNSSLECDGAAAFICAPPERVVAGAFFGINLARHSPVICSMELVIHAHPKSDLGPVGGPCRVPRHEGQFCGSRDRGALRNFACRYPANDWPAGSWRRRVSV